MAYSGEEHGQAQAVGGRDHFGIALRPARLNDGGGSGFGDFFDAIGKRKEVVGGGDGAVQRELGFHRTDSGGVNPTHLAGADAHRLPVASVDDGIGLHVLANFPGKQQAARFFGGGGAFGDNLEICVLQGTDIGVLDEQAAGSG